MAIESPMTRREFLQKGNIALTAVLGGALLSESGKGIVGADSDQLHGFLESPSVAEIAYGPRLKATLAHLEVERPCDVQWVHRSNSRSKLDHFFDSPLIQFAELDFRFDPERGLYIGHDKGDRSDIDPEYLLQRLSSASTPKAIKYDCKDDDSIREVIRIVPDEPFILNAGLFGNDNYRLSPQDVVNLADHHPGVIFSIGRDLHKPRYSDRMMEEYAALVRRNPDQEFTIPVHIIELMSGTAPFEDFLALPHTTVTVFRTQGFELTQGHVRWLQSHIPDQVRAQTFFDL